MVALAVPNHYAKLEVSETADSATIKKAYRKQVLRCHPDKVEEAKRAQKRDEFEKVQEAYEILIDPAKRSDYDNKLKLARVKEVASRFQHVTIVTAEPKAPTLSRMYSQSGAKSCEDELHKTRRADDAPRTFRRTASCDDQSSTSKKDDDRQRWKSHDEKDRQRREEDVKEQRRSEKDAAAVRHDKEYRLKREAAESKKSSAKASSYTEKYGDGDDETFIKSDKKKPSSVKRDRDRDQDRDRDRNRDRDRDRDRNRDRERDRSSDRRPRERASSQRPDASEKHVRDLEQAQKYIKSSMKSPNPPLSRAHSSYARASPKAPMPPPMSTADDEEIARRAAKIRRGSQEKTPQPSSSKKATPSFKATLNDDPYIVDVSPSGRHNLPRSSTATERDFVGRPPLESLRLHRAETYHYGDRDTDLRDPNRGRHRSRHQAQGLGDPLDDTDDEYRPEYPSRQTFYTANDDRASRRDREPASYRVIQEPEFSKTSFQYVQAPPLNIRKDSRPVPVPRDSGYGGSFEKVTTAPSYSERDVRFTQSAAPFPFPSSTRYRETSAGPYWSGVPAS